MELLEGLMAHKSSFHPAHCSPVFVLAVPGLPGPQHWNRRSRKVVRRYGVSISVSIPGLNIAPASSAIPECPGKVLLVQRRRPCSLATPTGDSAAMKWRQIGQPLSVESALLLAAVLLVMPHAGSACTRAGIRWHRRPMPLPAVVRCYPADIR